VSIRSTKPITPHRSGWCLKLPVSEWTQGEHDKCPQTFPAGDCECTCGHKGSRSLESRGMSYRAVVKPKPVKIETMEEDSEEE
jgi:hypothetical protein